MKTKKGYWTILIISIIVIILFLFIIGCDDYFGPEARIAGEIKVYSVNGRQCDDVSLDADGRVKKAVGYLVARYFITPNDPVAVGGLRAKVETPSHAIQYYYLNAGGGGYWGDLPDDKAGIKSNLTTNSQGYARFDSWCSHWPGTSVQATMWISGKYAPMVGVGGVFRNGYISGTGLLVPFYAHYFNQDTGFWVIGGDYYSGTMASESVPASVISTAASTSAMNTFSDGEVSFLAESCQQPQSGFSIVETEWCMQTAENGVRPVSNFVILDHCDPNTIKYYSTPYFMSVSLSLADQIDQSCVGVSVPATIRFGTRAPVSIKASIVAISPDGLRAVAHTDYFVAVHYSEYNLESPEQQIYDRWSDIADPNLPEIDIYAPLFLPVGDPNFPPIIDPNDIECGVVVSRLNPERFKVVYVLPAGDRETVHLHFENSVSGLALIQYWLSGNKAVDINNDGIANFNDLPN